MKSIHRRHFFRSLCGLTAGGAVGACNAADAMAPHQNIPNETTRLVNGGGTLGVSPDGEVYAAPALGRKVVIRGDADVVTGLEVVNSNPGTAVQSEIRVSNGNGAGDFWISGERYADGSNWLPNEVGVVAESTAAGLHLRANADTYIRFSVGVRPVEWARISPDGIELAGRFTTNDNPSLGGVLYAENGALRWQSAEGTITELAPR